MKILVQRVNSSRVEVAGKTIGSIEKGYTLLVGIETRDTKEIVEKMATKVLKLRIMPDEEGKMNKDLSAAAGSILAISQFTLCADTKKGNRPSFLDAMKPDTAHQLFKHFVKELQKQVRVEMGEFGGYMQVYIQNDGPTTIWLDSKESA
jgi:D-tyrosyl-tRNA(Tyr) deacylase